MPHTIERVRNGHTGRKELRTQPYTREVNRLLDNNQLNEVNIQEPVFSYNAGIMVTTPDLSLKCFINKTEDTTQAKHITEMHIMKYYRSHYHIYTDGSKNPSENKAGAAFVVFDPYSKEICSSALKLDPRVSIFTCEATAIQHALKWIPENMPRNIAIFTDSLSVLQSINTGRSHSRSDIIVDIIHKISHLSKIGIHVSLIWVPSHVGIMGNERVDQLAKQGSENGAPKQVKLAVSDVNSIIKAKSREFFRQRWLQQDTMRCALSEHIPSKMQIYSTNTGHDKIITRLRLGRNGLGWENYSDKHLCPHCTEYETFNHVFFDIHKECTRNAEHRLELECGLLKLGLVCIDRKTLLFPPKEVEQQVYSLLIHFITKIGYLNRI
ncbi:uncharacterized protein LOC128558251 [Mercenaria mercenaria]|uniref:uncharacterized protein LOC128558251 n=1 Tax=Mercenaria mercenaria TaxID=6596 RepID=UPI00234FB122|nr:uncharacterized protein LOC128558251 [Mercenaria mercenaria]